MMLGLAQLTAYWWHGQVEGNGFLFRQVRHMLGACVGVGLRKTSLEHVQKLLTGGAELRTGKLACVNLSCLSVCG